MADCSINNIGINTRKRSSSKFKTFSNCNNAVSQIIKGIFSLNVDKIEQISKPKVNLVGIGEIRSKPAFDMNLAGMKRDNNGFIDAHLSISGVILARPSGIGSIETNLVDKFAGEIGGISSLVNFRPVQKLYPIRDIESESTSDKFINKDFSNSDLFSSIDEGIFVGNYNENRNIGFGVSDNNDSYILPSSTISSGVFNYKCEVTRPYHHPENSFLFIRVSAPFFDGIPESRPTYRLFNLVLEDPSGNTIIKYKDILINGDANYSSDKINYTTYISEPEINNANLHTWEDDYPILNESSGYKLNLDCEISCNSFPFAPGFNFGYEENSCTVPKLVYGENDYLSLDGSPLSTQNQNLDPITQSLRISAIEIVNSGDLCNICNVSGIKHDGYFGLYTERPLQGQRLRKVIRPVELFPSTYDPEIYPTATSVWSSSPDYDDNVFLNIDKSKSRILLNQLNNLAELQFITLVESSPLSDSGRLTLKFSHEPPQPKATQRGGEFYNWAFAKNTFDVADRVSVTDVDNFFVVDSLELRVTARKAVGSRDYVLDVVGYSDDKLLNVTPKVGAFLQNTNTGIGTVPLASGFDPIDDLGLSTEAISDKQAFFERSLTSIDAGDHYKLSSLPIVDSTQFKEYVIPLTIYEDYVDVGKSIDYSMSSYFENLYIDLFPIPIGASISKIELVVYYKPSNAFNLVTFAKPSARQLDKKDIRLVPTNRILEKDISLNSNIEDAPLSLIENIPQAYKEHTTLKTNYSRRWRGVEGNITVGPYDFSSFDFSFYNPQVDHPFLNGLFDFNKTENGFVLPNNAYLENFYDPETLFIPQVSGYYNGNSQIIKNIGLRFKDDQLFPHNTDYTSIDWSLEGDPLYGKISDAFDCALRVSGEYGNINFGNIPTNSGFALYLRYTPDYNMSGVGYDLYNSGILLSKWDSGKNLELVLALESGRITAILNDANQGIIKLQDDQTYDEYQYPLSIVLTHEGSGNPVRLYCNNELSDVQYLKNSTVSVSLVSGDSNLVIGYSSGSGVGSNIFVHEIGISSSGNLTNTLTDPRNKRITVSSFLDGQSHHFASNYSKFKLDDFIDENVENWNLGEFKPCSFSVAFDGFTDRIGKDYIVHYLNHHGSGYDQILDTTTITNVNASGLAYHTQIENDFLRFNLTDIPDANPHFYAVPPRICKTIPRGYKFDERAMVVETILEHETNNDILWWKDGNVGPKLIVSLYSKNQDPVDRPSKVNWGLINRSIHYLEPSGCYEKISSTFNHNDLLDTSEPWALFDLENIEPEFTEKYYSKDVDDMYLQYDLVYPCSTFKLSTIQGQFISSKNNKLFNSQQCGSPFESKIKIHSVNVRLENALTYWTEYNDNLSIYTSGQAIRFNDIPLFTHGHESIFESGFYLYTSGAPWTQSSGIMNLILEESVSGIINNSFNLVVRNRGFFNSPGQSFGSLFGSSDQIIYLPINVSGGHPRLDEFMSLVMSDNVSDQTSSESVSLHTKSIGLAPMSGSLNMQMPYSYATFDITRSGVMSLYITNSDIITSSIDGSFSLYINTDSNILNSSGTCSLYTINYGTAGTRGFFSWDKNNLGFAIDPIVDSGVPALGPDDEIRGVDLICFGDCSNERRCEEEPIVLHNLVWYGDATCVDGGIFRPKGVYTNPEASGFNTNVGYDRHFYGIRKYPNLLSNAPYDITITVKTGTNSTIYLPSEYTELDYGSNDLVNYSGVKLAADKDLSNGERQAGNKYGKSVAVVDDVIAVGAPFQTLEYTEGPTTYTLNEAGCVFIYKRDPRPDGYSWPIEEHKSQWRLDTKLTLPSGLFKDYYTEKTIREINGFPIGNNLQVIQRNWQVGGEGRQLGHSLGLAINENMTSFQEDRREVIVVGGPSAKWYREFNQLQPSGVNIGLLVFSDEFIPEISIPVVGGTRKLTYADILDSIQNKDLEFTYFSKPPVNFNVKIAVCEPRDERNYGLPIEQFKEPKPDFVSHFVIPRNSGIITSPGNTSRITVFNAIKSVFEQVFPYDETKINNNIPVMLGIFIDDSLSLGSIALEPGLSDFINYYREYSFASGLRDFYGVQSSGAAYKKLTPTENWIDASIEILNDLLDTGRLRARNEVRFFSSGVGQEFFNSDLDEFNIPPFSGGNVYVFEKESGSWNLIQEIKSPVLSYEYDRFGHAVAISKDTNIIGIGSPYINECCQIWQYNPQSKQQVFSSLSNFLNLKNSEAGGTSIRYGGLLEQYSDWTTKYGADYANQILYSNLTQTEKFEVRQKFNISEYQKVFSYSYSDIPYVGEAWSWISEEFAPTSRLGYSVAVNEDGNAVAFGAPTDSFNVFDDKNVYFTGDQNSWLRKDLIAQLTAQEQELGIPSNISASWQNSVNAGAVRLFEGRDYYPHSKVVEFGKFGNLQQSLNDPLDSGHFDYLSGIFRDRGFRKMPEDEVEIPQDAGLAFIITPGVDALSDEVVDNIISWLALGDRNLVLVGNDPVWENNGIYNRSNEIINNLLFRLNSRMRIYPARNIEEALVKPSSVALPSHRPSRGITSSIESYVLKTAYGVGDIRMFYPYPVNGSIKETMPCFKNNPNALFFNYRSLNEKCELPLMHNGDLRAEWNEVCFTKGTPPRPIIYPINWGFRLGTSLIPCGEDEAGDIDSVGGVIKGRDMPMPSGEPVPLLAAALVKRFEFTQPATPPIYSYTPVYREIGENELVWRFVEEELSQTPAFIWDSDTADYTEYEINIFNIQNRSSSWFRPRLFEGRQSILQANSAPAIETIIGTEKVADKSAICVEESLPNNSKIIAISTVETESNFALLSFNDENIAFYKNLVSKNRRGEAKVLQLGGWTGRASFKDAYESSVLAEIIRQNNNDLIENYIIDDVLESELRLYDVIWIANPTGLPNSNQVNKLKSWLSSGNKKLIVSYNTATNQDLADPEPRDMSQMLIANEILRLLNSNIQTIYLQVKEKYPVVRADVVGSNTPVVNQNHPISDRIDDIETFSWTFYFYPFAENENVAPLLYVNLPVFDDKIINFTNYRMNPGVDRISFPAIPGSGYRIFINTVSENLSENEPISVFFYNVGAEPKLPYPEPKTFEVLLKEKETDPDRKLFPGASLFLESPQKNNVVKTEYIDLQVQESSNTIDLYFSSIDGNIEAQSFIPKTIRILSISGVPIPIDQQSKLKSTQTVLDRYDVTLVQEGSPERKYFVDVTGVIKSINDPYCGYDVCFPERYNNQLIADGPVVAAQEIEMVTSFPAGVARSRITVLSDSNLVQGRYMVDENKTMSLETVNFIKSMYPQTIFPNQNVFGKQYIEVTKIVSPERGSPAKYKIFNNEQDLLVNFGSDVFTDTDPESFNHSESLYLPKSITNRPNKKNGEAWSPETRPEAIEKIKAEVRALFKTTEVRRFGGYPRFSGVIDEKLYVDAGIGGGIPDLLRDKGYDYLDPDCPISGYKGDLFGYSVAIQDGKLIIGSPFNAFSDEEINDWEYYVDTLGESGLQVSYNGGAGAVYVYEKTFKGYAPGAKLQPWEMVQKLRPTSINIGQDISDTGVSQSYSILGPNSYSEEYLTQNSIITDQFGYSVAIDSDIIIVGAPGHDFGKYAENVFEQSATRSGEFIRKEFNGEFDIPQRLVVELGNSGIREDVGSGISVLNNGAIFTFENSIDDWTQRSRKWQFIEKIVPQGINSREQLLNENDAFGRSVSINRANRTDSDYVIVGGSENHSYSSSGTNMSLNAGAAYTHDIMLRQPPPVLPNPNTYIDYKVFGSKLYNDYIVRNITNNSEPNKEFVTSGVAYTDERGNMFLEVSGQDPVARGFIQHRPYVVSVQGIYKYGSENSGNLPLYVGGRYDDVPENMNLFIASTTGNVYNTLGLYSTSIVDFGSGILNLNIGNDPITISDSGLYLYTSGAGIISDNLNLRIRGY